MRKSISAQYDTLCQNEQYLNDKLHALIKDQESKRKHKRHKKKAYGLKPSNNIKSCRPRSPMVQRYKKWINDINISATNDVLQKEKEISAITVSSLEHSYDKSLQNVVI